MKKVIRLFWGGGVPGVPGLGVVDSMISNESQTNVGCIDLTTIICVSQDVLTATRVMLIPSFGTIAMLIPRFRTITDGRYDNPQLWYY